MSDISTPAYKVIREDIVQDILNGVYEPGQLIKGQEFYAKKFGVSRTTVRKAIDDLTNRGVLIPIKGKGTFVRNGNRSKEKGNRKLSFSGVDRVKHERLTSKVIEISTLPASASVSKHLKIEEGGLVICIKRLRLVSDIPENYQICYINKRSVEAIDFEKEYLETGSLFELLQNKAKLIPKYSEEEIRAVRCPARVAEEFGIERNDPVLLITRTTYTIDNMPMEYCEDYECTDFKGLKVRTYV